MKSILINWPKNGIILTIMALILGCSSDDEDSGTRKSYDFSLPISSSIIAAENSSFVLADFKKKKGFNVDIQGLTGPTLCSSVVCINPTALSGKYYGTGLSIQSMGNGMMAYFGQESWALIAGSSPKFDFSTTNPIINSGNLICCAGSGDLSNENSYIESVAYLFSYLDASFTVTGITGNTNMNGNYTFRFILADDAVTTGRRGDVLVLDSGVFKWMDSVSENLSSTRPSNPVTMDSAVKNYVNPFGQEKGNQEIPVIYSFVTTPTDDKMQISETDLRATGKRYTYSFNMTNFLIFPTLLKTDLNMITSLKDLMSKIHLAGLPHSQQPLGIGNPADTLLVISDAGP